MLAPSFTKTTDPLNAKPEQHASARSKCSDRGQAIYPSDIGVSGVLTPRRTNSPSQAQHAK
ncbi:hypothetical protein ACVILL_004190 [Bradyrhizobium sp. USDA 3364]